MLHLLAPFLCLCLSHHCMIVDMVLSSTTDKRVDEQAGERADELADKQDGLTKAFQEVLAART